MSDGTLPANIGRELAARMVEVRRQIHRNPELSHDEHNTADLVARTLRTAGVSDLVSVFNTGIVATIRGGKPGRTLALRGDMDALPIQENRPDLPFASQNPGVMHACGHDVHTAIVLGVALELHRRRAELPGTVRVIFQPAEEKEPVGAPEVIKAGHLKGVDGILSLHVDPEIPVGSIGVRAGALLAGGQEFTITVRGRASHAARPHLGIDAIAATCAIVSELQKIRSRRTDPLEPVVVTIGRIEGGTASNIIADKCTILGTLRVLDEALRGEVVRLMAEIAENVARANGAEATLDTRTGEPVLYNDPAMTELVRISAVEILGPDRVREVRRPSMGSEDFAFYVREVPGMMMRLGIRNEDAGMIHPLHHPQFAVDERAIPIGAAVLLAATERFLNAKS